MHAHRQSLHWEKGQEGKLQGKEQDYIVEDGLAGCGFKHNLFAHKLSCPVSSVTRSLLIEDGAIAKGMVAGSNIDSDIDE